MFRQIDVVSIYVEDNVWYKRRFSFDPDNEIHDDECIPLSSEENHILQTKVTLTDCINQDLKPLTAKSAEDIAKGIKNHCLIYYLCGEFPIVNVVETIDGKSISIDVNSLFRLESKDKEKDIYVREELFKLYIMKSPKKSDRKCNYVTFCANSRTVGGKRDLSKTDSLFLYPILENGNSIFLPCAGILVDNTLWSDNTGASYQTSTQGGDGSANAWTLSWNKDCNSAWLYLNNTGEYYPFYNRNVSSQRYHGRVIRPVANTNAGEIDGMQLNILTDSASWHFGDTSARIYGTLSTTTPVASPLTVGFIIGDNDSITKPTAQAVYPQSVSSAGQFSHVLPVHDNFGCYYRAFVEVGDSVFYGKVRHYGLEFVDLGIGTLWANMNVGANTPEEYGNYYAWGETMPKTDYSQSTYQFGTQNLGNNYNINGTRHDAAHVNMGNAWLMPTSSELKDLNDKCTWQWTTQNNVTGYKVTGPNGNSIFLPCAGLMRGSNLDFASVGASYATSTLYGEYSWHTWTLSWYQQYSQNGRYFISNNEWVPFQNYGSGTVRYFGRTIRAVYKPNAVDSDNKLNILTDSATWRIGDTSARVYGVISSFKPLANGCKVGFVVGDSMNIEKHNATVYTVATDTYGRFSANLTINNNIGKDTNLIKSNSIKTRDNNINNGDIGILVNINQKTEINKNKRYDKTIMVNNNLLYPLNDKTGININISLSQFQNSKNSKRRINYLKYIKKAVNNFYKQFSDQTKINQNQNNRPKNNLSESSDLNFNYKFKDGKFKTKKTDMIINKSSNLDSNKSNIEPYSNKLKKINLNNNLFGNSHTNFNKAIHIENNILNNTNDNFNKQYINTSIKSFNNRKYRSVIKKNNGLVAGEKFYCGKENNQKQQNLYAPNFGYMTTNNMLIYNNRSTEPNHIENLIKAKRNPGKIKIDDINLTMDNPKLYRRKILKEIVV